MITIETLRNTFKTQGTFVNHYDSLRKFKTASITLRLPTTLEMKNEMELRYQIDLQHIMKPERTLVGIKPLIDDGWLLDEEENCLYLPLS